MSTVSVQRAELLIQNFLTNYDHVQINNLYAMCSIEYDKNREHTFEPLKAAMVAYFYSRCKILIDDTFLQPTQGGVYTQCLIEYVQEYFQHYVRTCQKQWNVYSDVDSPMSIPGTIKHFGLDNRFMIKAYPLTAVDGAQIKFRLYDCQAANGSDRSGFVIESEDITKVLQGICY